MKTLKQLKEDAPTNAVGGGNIAGAGVGPQGEPGVKKVKRKVMPLMGFLQRKQPVNK